MFSLTYALLSLVFGASGLIAGAPAAEPSRAPEAAARPAAPAPVAFLAEARAVSNWRDEAVQDLRPSPLSALAVALRVERPVITRCVKLNNYWCIKSARWNGELGADDEGHTGFASAEQGADAAVRLLRRYYLEFDRKSALDIVRRWAPAECHMASGSGSPVTLALRGLGNTLRARWLAAHRSTPVRTKVASASGPVPLVQKPAPSRVSRVPMRPLPTFHMPSIMAGVDAAKPATISASLAAPIAPHRQPTPASVAAAKAALAKRTAVQSEPKPTVARIRPAAVKPVTPAAPAPPPRPETVASADVSAPASRPAPVATGSTACAPDEQRIQNYASRIVQGLGLKPGDDLNLFEPDGRPLPNLERVLLAMSSFELGFLHASLELVEGAIARATPPPPPGPTVPPVEPIL